MDERRPIVRRDGLDDGVFWWPCCGKTSEEPVHPPGGCTPTQPCEDRSDEVEPIQRWSDQEHDTVPHPDGKWVRYSDHAAEREMWVERSNEQARKLHAASARLAVSETCPHAAEVERLTRERDDALNSLAADETFARNVARDCRKMAARAESAEAEVERLTREREDWHDRSDRHQREKWAAEAALRRIWQIDTGLPDAAEQSFEIARAALITAPEEEKRS